MKEKVVELLLQYSTRMFVRILQNHDLWQNSFSRDYCCVSRSGSGLRLYLERSPSIWSCMYLESARMKLILFANTLSYNNFPQKLSYRGDFRSTSVHVAS